MTFFIIPRFQPGRRHRFDILGVVLASLALLAICYGLVEGQRYDWGTVTSFITIPLIIAVGVVLLAVFLLVQKLRQEREPLIPFALFRNRNFTLMNWVSCTLSIGMLGIFLPLTIYLQSALGFSALKAGLTLAPSSLVMIILAPVLGRLHRQDRRQVHPDHRPDPVRGGHGLGRADRHPAFRLVRLPGPR